MQYTEAVDGTALTPEEKSELTESMGTALRLMTKAGILMWKKRMIASHVDNLRSLRTDIEYEAVTEVPIFTCDLTVDAGALKIEQQDQPRIIEVGPKISMASLDANKREHGELVFDVTYELLSEIAQSATVAAREQNAAGFQS